MSASIPVKPLTFLGKFSAICGLVKALLAGAIGILLYPLISSANKQPTLSREFSRRMLRVLLTELNTLQLQWINPPSKQAYLAWMKASAMKEGVPTEPFSQDLVAGGKLHWVGKRSATKVILHLHSGGYALSLNKGHLNLINYFRKEILRRSHVDVKLAFLEYTLTPYATYPTQFRQALSALQTILSSGITPSNILITGDSAGGQLALQLLGHALHPHPSLPPLEVSHPLAGILVLAPWTSFGTETPSWTYNLSKDILLPEPMKEWAAAVRKSTLLRGDNFVEDGGYWIEPTLAPPEWWTGTEKVTEHLLFVWGEREVLKDSVVECVKRVRKGVQARGVVEVKGIEDPNGIHISPTFDASLQIEPGETAKIMAGWVVERLIT